MLGVDCRIVVAVREFVVARHPEDGSSLPTLVRPPLPEGAVVSKVGDVWPCSETVDRLRALEWLHPDVWAADRSSAGGAG